MSIASPRATTRLLLRFRQMSPGRAAKRGSENCLNQKIEMVSRITGFRELSDSRHRK